VVDHVAGWLKLVEPICGSTGRIHALDLPRRRRHAWIRRRAAPPACRPHPGISGIVDSALTARDREFGWRATFLLGLLAAPTALRLFAGPTPPNIETPWTRLAIAGLLVGFGTRLGSGCTSGHGICGLSRLSPRSLVATLTFMFAGFVTVYVVRHLAG